MSEQFLCPRCGGWAFGHIVLQPSPDLLLRGYRCDSDITGKPMTNEAEPCGWRGRRHAGKHPQVDIKLTRTDD